LRAEAAIFAARIYAALGDETRLAIVERLVRDGPSSIVRLGADAAMSRQAVTKHLHVLEKAGLVTKTRNGRESLWRLERRRLEEARRYLDEISRQWDNALDRLRAHVETEE